MGNDRKKFFAGTKSIVTGGAGFIGSHLCEELVDLGSNVVCLDDFSAGKQSNVAFLKKFPNFKIVKKDVCDDDNDMRQIFEGANFVFHNAASKKNICLVNPQRDLLVNSGGALNMLKYSLEFGIKKFIQASTGSVYGEPQIFPTTETHPFLPVSYYGVSKLAGERYVDVFNKLDNLDTTILRYFHVYGPRQESNEFGGVVSIFLRRILENKNPIVFGHGNQVRSFTWVKDLVNANIEAVITKKSKGEVYNVASGIKISINELAAAMLELLDPDQKLKVEHGEPLIGDIMNFDVDNTKIRNQLGVDFNKDFWGTLKIALTDSDSFLGN